MASVRKTVAVLLVAVGALVYFGAVHIEPLATNLTSLRFVGVLLSVFGAFSLYQESRKRGGAKC